MDRGSVIVRQINGQKKRKKRGERLKEMLAKQGIIWRRRVKNEREREREISYVGKIQMEQLREQQIYRKEYWGGGEKKRK